MSNKQFDQAIEFNRDILGIQQRLIGLQEEDEFKLSMTQLKEEISEIEAAYAEKDLTGVADGLIDLEYFLYGIFYKLGLEEPDHQTLFTIVHRANLAKKMGCNPSRPGFTAVDAIKPKDWTAPEELMTKYLEAAHRVQQRKLA